MAHHCPNCQRVLHNRRLTHCDVCGAAIPEELRFSPEEIAALDRKMQALSAQRLKKDRVADKEHEEAQRRRAVDGGSTFLS